MEQAELAAIHARAEREFKKIPGVVAVGFGLKEVGGETTDQRALRVYVSTKKPPEALAPDERIPDEFEGIPTDVLRVPRSQQEPCEDQTRHSRLIGGISITTFKRDSGGAFDMGTLGFFATLDGVAGPKNVVLVTNNHVLAHNGGGVGDLVYQPEWRTVDGQSGWDSEITSSAKIHNIGQDGNYSFAYPTEGAQNYYVDCASALLAIKISSWCDTNCGVSYKNEIRGLAIIPDPPAPQVANSRIEGFTRVTQADVDAPGDYAVYKVGRTTSRTAGKVVEVAAPLQGGKERVIIVEVVGVDCDNIQRFSDSGDSGAALVNSRNQIVGIHFGHDPDDPRRSHSAHIHPVLHLLGITPISTANPPVGPAGHARADLAGAFADQADESLRLRDRFLATPRGADLHARALRHSAEVIGLVNECRPVTVAWHRSGGPAFLAHLIANLRDTAHRIPQEVDGVGRAALLRRMADVLGRHGSPDLRAAVDEALDEVLELAAAVGDDVRPLLAQLEREAEEVSSEAS